MNTDEHRYLTGAASGSGESSFEVSRSVFIRVHLWLLMQTWGATPLGPSQEQP